MTPSAKNKLLAWLDNVFLKVRPEGSVSNIDLLQAHAGGGESALHAWGPYEEDARDVDCASLVEEAHQLSEEDAQGFGATQRYCLIAWFGPGRIHSQRSPVWVESVRVENEALVAESEPATAKGERAMQMRHNEAIMKLALGAATQQQQIMSRMIERLSEQNENLQQYKQESIKVVERMLTQEAERQIMARKAQNHERRMDQALEQLQLLAPVVVNKLSGKNLLPTSTTPTEEILARVLGDLDEKQLAALQNILKPSQAVAVWELYETYRKRHEEKERARKEKEEEKSHE